MHKSIRVYDNENAKLTKFFSTSSLEDLYDTLGCYAGNRILKFTFELWNTKFIRYSENGKIDFSEYNQFEKWQFDKDRIFLIS